MSWTIEIWINFGTNHDKFWPMYLIQHDIVSFSSCATVNSLQKHLQEAQLHFKLLGLHLCVTRDPSTWTWLKNVMNTGCSHSCYRLTHLSYKSCKSWKLNQHLRSLTNGNKLCDKPTGWEQKEHRGQSSVKVMALICSRFPFSCIGQVKLMRVLHERAPMCDKALIRPQSQLWLLRFFKATRSQDWFAAKIW
jgi:hypothetical protein